MSKFKFTGGKQELSNCGDYRPQLKNRPELETANKEQLAENDLAKSLQWSAKNVAEVVGA